MSELTRKEIVQGFINTREQQIQSGVSLVDKGVLESEIEAFKAELEAINAAEQAQSEQEAAQQVRIAAQEEKVSSITLPYNFNDIFDNSSANDMIIELVQEFQRKSYADHNMEMESTKAIHAEELLQVRRQYDILQNDLDRERKQAILDAAEHSELLQRIAQLENEKQQAIFERDDFESKLKNATDEIDRLNSHIDDLRKDAVVGARESYKIVDINPSDRLAQLVKQSEEEKKRKAHEEIAAKGLERWAAMMPDVVAPPVALEVPTFLTSSNTISELDEAQPITIPTEDTVNNFRNEEVQTISDTVVEGSSSENGQSQGTVTAEQLEARLQQFAVEHGLVKQAVA